MRKNISSTLLVLSTAMALVMLASPLLLLSSPFLQPVKAQIPMTFKTPTPAQGDEDDSLTFDAYGTTSTSDPQRAEITNGTIQWQADKTYTGEIYSGSFNNNTRGGDISFNAKMNNLDYSVSSTKCSTSDSNPIHLSGPYGGSDFNGPVECSPTGGGGGGITASSSSAAATTTTQDSDGDGIPDSSDRCVGNSNSRCFKEEGTK